MTHTPVLLSEMLAVLSPRSGEVYVDATFGGGGYSRAILEAANCQVMAFDRDPDAVERGKKLEEDFPDRFQIRQGRFSQLKAILQDSGIAKVHGFIFDLGVSSYQLDEAKRGFSFRYEGPLDMRMSQEGLSAVDVINTYPEKELADIIYRYGEEKKSRVIARKIVATRLIEPFRTTTQLANVVQSVVKRGREDQNPATLTFQALRIFVNDELIEIDSGLKAAEDCLVPGGRLVVVTFHSLEDRLVKQFLRARQGNDKGNDKTRSHLRSRYLPPLKEGSHPIPTFALPKGPGMGMKGVTTPSEDEQFLNPRARSARLRIAIRLPIPHQPLFAQERGR